MTSPFQHPRHQMRRQAPSRNHVGRTRQKAISLHGHRSRQPPSCANKAQGQALRLICAESAFLFHRCGGDFSFGKTKEKWGPHPHPYLSGMEKRDRVPPAPLCRFSYSPISCRTKLPRMPLMNFTVSGVSYFLAISTASLMAAPLGMSGM